MAAFLSAFLDADSHSGHYQRGVGFYSVYHKVASGKQCHHDHNHQDDGEVQQTHRSDLRQFRAFLRSPADARSCRNCMEGSVQVGEPQNLLIAARMGWNFGDFFMHMAPVSLPVLFAGLLPAISWKKRRWFGYRATLPQINP